MISVREATYKGKELPVLMDLIRKRQEFMSELPKQAITAVCIDLTISLRAQTKIAAEKINVARADFAEPGYITRNRVQSRCLRVMGRLVPFVNLAGGYINKNEKLIVYSVQVYKNGRPEVVYVVCRHPSQVQAWASKRVARYRGLAKLAWGKLANRISNRVSSDQSDGATPQAHSVARRSVTSVQTESLTDFSVDMSDDLNYARAALQNGDQSIAHAMQAAANKNASKLQQFLKVHPFFDAKVETPFPDIVKARKK